MGSPLGVLLIRACGDPGINRQKPFGLFAHFIGLMTFERDSLVNELLASFSFRRKEAPTLAKVNLANYFAGAAILPYQATLTAARELRHDLDALAIRFGTSVEPEISRNAP